MCQFTLSITAKYHVLLFQYLFPFPPLFDVFFLHLHIRKQPEIVMEKHHIRSGGIMMISMNISGLVFLEFDGSIMFFFFACCFYVVILKENKVLLKDLVLEL